MFCKKSVSIDFKKTCGIAAVEVNQSNLKTLLVNNKPKEDKF